MLKFFIFLYLYLWTVFKRIGYVVFFPIYTVLLLVAFVVLAIVIDPIFNLLLFIFSGKTCKEFGYNTLKKLESSLIKFGNWLKS